MEYHGLSSATPREVRGCLNMNETHNRCLMVGQLDCAIECNGRVYDPDGISPTITTWGGGRRVKIVEPTIGAIRGRNPDNPKSREVGLPTQQTLEIKPDGTSDTLTTVKKDNVVVLRDGKKIRIRNLTPRECWRLMDFADADFDKASAVASCSQLYKQAGNSIVVNCLVAIFGQMFKGKENEYRKRKNEQ